MNRCLIYMLGCLFLCVAIPPAPANENIAAKTILHDQKGLFSDDVLSTGPEAKVNWKFTRAKAEEVDGPVPLILIHGLSTDFWAAFEAWAAESPEADEFRQRFQLWKFLSPNDGVNAAVGFASEYDGFDESLAAYLNRFIESAQESGSEGTDGNTYVFPEGPFCMLTHSQGGVTARAFLVNFPDKLDRCQGVVTLSAPHMGSPGATPEWVRYTVGGLGRDRATVVSQLVRGAFSDFVLNDYLSTQRQSDMDMGWANYDARGIGGIPTLSFRAWIPGNGFHTWTLSPRDGNQTGSRELADFDDDTFEPAELLPNYCGGIDRITPESRGELGLNKFFLYGAYLQPVNNWQDLIEQIERARDEESSGLAYNLALRLLNLIMAEVETPGSQPPLGVYLLNDGFVPLQSQLMLDGLESRVIFKTRVVAGHELPLRPFVPRVKDIRQHTLAKPSRIRVLEGWSHYDTVTGRYDSQTKSSPLFPRVTDDLLSVLP